MSGSWSLCMEEGAGAYRAGRWTLVERKGVPGGCPGDASCGETRGLVDLCGERKAAPASSGLHPASHGKLSAGAGPRPPSLSCAPTAQRGAGRTAPRHMAQSRDQRAGKNGEVKKHSSLQPAHPLPPHSGSTRCQSGKEDHTGHLPEKALPWVMKAHDFHRGEGRKADPKPLDQEVSSWTLAVSSPGWHIPRGTDLKMSP